MKKRGFSLAEVLITMSIIAISAALLAPAYNRFKPDKYKFKVLNCYKVLNKVTDDLISNQDLYHQTRIPDNIPDEDWYTTHNVYVNGDILNPETQWGCLGLGCTQNTELENNHPFLSNSNPSFQDSDFGGFCKYPNLLLRAMALENVTKCAEPSRTASGTSSNRIRWIITADTTNSNGQYSQGTVYNVMVDMNGDETPNKFYNQDGERHPDRFVFRVDTGGDITGGDPLTSQYLENMTNIQKEDDYNAAAGG